MKKRILIAALFLCQYICAQNWTVLPGLSGSNMSAGIHGFYNDTVSNTLLAMGSFDSIGIVHAQGVAAWDGNAWSALGIQLFPNAPTIHSAVRYNGDLYFSATIPNWSYDYTYITRWNGVTLDSIATVKIFAASGLLTYQNDLVAFGNIDTINTTPVNSVGRWNGTNWTDMGQGTFSGVWDAIVYNGVLYVAGFSSADNNFYVFRYVNNAWEIVGQRFSNGVYHLCIYKNELYAGGYHNASSSQNAITKLDTLTDTWNTIGGGVSSTTIATFSQIDGMCVYDSALYVVGVFDHAGGIPASYVAKWDGTQWCGFGVGNSYQLTNCTSYNDTFYISTGLIFDTDTTKGFVKWSGGNYTDTCGFLSTGVTEQIQQDFSIQVFPNPASENLIFEIGESYLNGEIIITDQLGKAVMTKKINGESHVEISVTDLVQGMYFFHVIDDKAKTTTGKFIVQ